MPKRKAPVREADWPIDMSGPEVNDGNWHALFFHRLNGLHEKNWRAQQDEREVPSPTASKE